MSTAALLLSAAALAGCVVVADAATPAPRTHAITITQMRFRPVTLTVREGDTVEWVNDDLVPHTATSRQGAFDSDTIATGGRWRWVVRTRGPVAYVCTLHPTMSARLQVR